MHNKPTTQATVDLLVNKYIRPNLGDLKIAGINRSDIMKLHLKMSDTPSQANTILSIISKAFNLAEIWDWREESTNPVRLIKRYPET